MFGMNLITRSMLGALLVIVPTRRGHLSNVHRFSGRALTAYITAVRITPTSAKRRRIHARRKLNADVDGSASRTEADGPLVRLGEIDEAVPCRHITGPLLPSATELPWSPPRWFLRYQSRQLRERCCRKARLPEPAR